MVKADDAMSAGGQSYPELLNNIFRGGNETSDAPAASPETEATVPPILPEQVLNCMFGSWYPNFRRDTIKSKIIPLTPAFIAYLHEDGVVLPTSCVEEDKPSSDLDDWSSEEDSEVSHVIKRRTNTT